MVNLMTDVQSEHDVFMTIFSPIPHLFMVCYCVIIMPTTCLCSIFNILCKKKNYLDMF